MKIEIKCTYPTHTTTALTGSEKHEFNKVELIEMLKVRGYTNIEVKVKRGKRTLTQNGAKFMFDGWVEKHCAERGLGMTVFYDEPSEVPVTKEGLHKYFQNLCFGMYGTRETKKLNTAQFSKVVEAYLRELAEKVDFHEEFPNREALLLGKLKK